MTDAARINPLIDVQGELCRIKLNHPERRNALTVDVLQAIEQAVQQASKASVVLLSGAGPVFCSGFDMDNVREQDGYLQQLIAALSRTIRALRRCPATTLVHVQGAAIAGGCALAVACDIVMAETGSRFGYPVHQLGISPAVTLPVLLPAAGGFARRMVTEGRLYTAETLADKGVVHALLPEDGSSEAMVQTLLKRGTYASHVTKQWLNELEGAYDNDRFDGVADAQC